MHATGPFYLPAQSRFDTKVEGQEQNFSGLLVVYNIARW